MIWRLWGKTGPTPEEFHPALCHMLDVGHVAQMLLRPPASARWRMMLARVLGADPNTLADWLPWLIALHDIGKISVAFQTQKDDQKVRLRAEGFDFGRWRPALDLPHAILGQACAETEDLSPVHPGALWRAWQQMVGGHHGRFVAPADLRVARSNLGHYEPDTWRALRQDAAAVLQRRLLLTELDTWPDLTNISAAIMALTGFAIVCDWLGSDSAYFAPHPCTPEEEYVPWSAAQAKAAAMAGGFMQPSESNRATAFAELFRDKGTPRPLQSAIDAIPDATVAGPCLAVIEAPTGEGKTEAALALAHRLAHANGSDEFYYALPTTATSNQMFGRVQVHLRERLGLGTRVRLVHGQAFLQEDDLRIEVLDNGEGNDAGAALEWFGPKKRALVAPFGVGTIDQAELAALNVRHNALRMAGLAGKVLILDEVHAYDVYMTTIVERLLEWLASLGTSVIILSATLPQARRERLARAYHGEAKKPLQDGGAPQGYPSLWVVGQNGEHRSNPSAFQPARQVALGTLHIAEDDPEARARWLLDAVTGGGCACWMCNTVKRAQQLFAALDDTAPEGIERTLLHAQFPLAERERREQQIARRYGPGTAQRPARGIVVGTQVLEQSLDLDFDVMASDLAPVDLLLQRAGRLHRHQRPRPVQHAVPRLWLNTEMDEEGKLKVGVDGLIYAEYILQLTWATLAERAMMTLPTDYRPLVEAVYGAPVPGPGSALEAAWQKLQCEEHNALGEANLRLVTSPDSLDPFCTSLAAQQFVESENGGAFIIGRTRLGEESISVIPLECNGRLGSIPGSDMVVPLDRPAAREVQLALLRHSLRISNQQVVRAFGKMEEKPPRLLSGSALLKDYILLRLIGGQACLETKQGALVLTLDPRLGLVITKKGA